MRLRGRQYYIKFVTSLLTVKVHSKSMDMFFECTHVYDLNTNIVEYHFYRLHIFKSIRLYYVTALTINATKIYFCKL